MPITIDGIAPQSEQDFAVISESLINKIVEKEAGRFDVEVDGVEEGVVFDASDDDAIYFVGSVVNINIARDTFTLTVFNDSGESHGITVKAFEL